MYSRINKKNRFLILKKGGAVMVVSGPYVDLMNKEKAKVEKRNVFILPFLFLFFILVCSLVIGLLAMYHLPVTVFFYKLFGGLPGVALWTIAFKTALKAAVLSFLFGAIFIISFRLLIPKNSI